jgi:protein-tyrosine phosphatase
VVNLRIEFDDADAGIAPERYLYLPTEDDHAPTLEALSRGVAFIMEEIKSGGAVYVHCGSGIGRAATMAAAYLIDSGLTPDEAWAGVREARPFIRPTPPQLQQIERYADQTNGG